jgi:exodeoxyribonuclease VII small subunit
VSERDAGGSVTPVDPVAGLAFEGALDELEGLVDRLEAGDLALEQALATFERGVALSRRCADLLDRAEQRIDELVREQGGVGVRPFAGDGTPEG